MSPSMQEETGQPQPQPQPQLATMPTMTTAGLQSYFAGGSSSSPFVPSQPILSVAVPAQKETPDAVRHSDATSLSAQIGGVLASSEDLQKAFGDEGEGAEAARDRLEVARLEGANRELEAKVSEQETLIKQFESQMQVMVSVFL